ncbi:organic solute transporter Ostalpha-domain-containing protein, partial [Dipodascopsis uninucleata]
MNRVIFLCKLKCDTEWQFFLLFFQNSSGYVIELLTNDCLLSSILSITGVFALLASATSCASIFMHLKNYRKPLLQRYVIRIQFLIPIYSLASWLSLSWHRLAMFVEPIRDVYEAFVIYQFLWLLTNLLGGERSLIVAMYGKPPREHLFPFKIVFPKVDISDPHTLLTIKRGVLQYAWLKPVFAILAFLMKAIGIYKEGYISITSGYFWLGIIYNLSVSTSLYCLGLFWICLAPLLKPYRPMPKFLCIKLILFASYWQGFLLSILVWLGVIHDVGYYTPNNVARVVHNTLMCVEMLFFAIGHWYAFSYKDYVDDSIGSARLPVYYAIRDAFGMKDIVEDFKDTFRGEQYQYRLFDSVEAIEHPESAARLARLREGLRYQRGGETKYWLPTPSARRKTSLTDIVRNTLSDISRPISGVGAIALPVTDVDDNLIRTTRSSPSGSIRRSSDNIETENLQIDEEWIPDGDTETLFKNARAMPFGDYNYPVVTVNESLIYTPLIKKLNPNSSFNADPSQYSWMGPYDTTNMPSGSGRQNENSRIQSSSTPNLLMDLDGEVELSGLRRGSGNTSQIAKHPNLTSSIRS